MNAADCARIADPRGRRLFVSEESPFTSGPCEIALFSLFFTKSYPQCVRVFEQRRLPSFNGFRSEKIGPRSAEIFSLKDEASLDCCKKETYQWFILKLSGYVCYLISSMHTKYQEIWLALSKDKSREPRNLSSDSPVQLERGALDSGGTSAVECDVTRWTGILFSLAHWLSEQGDAIFSS